MADIRAGRPVLVPHPRVPGWSRVGFALLPEVSEEWRRRLVAELEQETDTRPVGIEPLVSTAYVWVVAPTSDWRRAAEAFRGCVERVNASESMMSGISRRSPDGPASGAGP